MKWRTPGSADVGITVADYPRIAAYALADEVLANTPAVPAPPTSPPSSAYQAIHDSCGSACRGISLRLEIQPKLAVDPGEQVPARRVWKDAIPGGAPWHPGVQDGRRGTGSLRQRNAQHQRRLIAGHGCNGIAGAISVSPGPAKIPSVMQ